MGITLSLIVPVYNMGHSIDSTLSHLVDQKEYLNDIEIIFIDDCSIDNTLHIINNYIFPNMKVIKNQTNLSSGVSRNIGIQHANGKFIGFLDGDDFYQLDVAFELIKNLEKDKLNYGAASYQDVGDTKQKGIWIAQEGTTSLLTGIKNIFRIVNPACWNKIHRRSFLIEKEITFPKSIYAEDLAFTIQCLGHCNQIFLLHKPIVTYLPPAQNEKSTYGNIGNGKWQDLFISLNHVKDIFEDDVKQHMFRDCAKHYIDALRKKIDGSLIFEFESAAKTWLEKLEKENSYE